MNNETSQNSGERFVLDEIDNAIDSLMVAAEFAGRVDPMKWKWVVIATQHALYSFCVAALGVRSPVMVVVPKRKGDKLSEDESANVIRWVEMGDEIELSARERHSLRRNIIPFRTALDRIQDGEFWMAQMFGAKPVSITKAELKNLNWVNEEAHNALIHFEPSQLILEIRKLKQACLDALRIIEFLVRDSNMLFDERELWKPRVETTLQKFRERLTSN